MRKKSVTVLIVVMGVLSVIGLSCVNSDAPNLFPVKQSGKWGYIDKSGDFVINPQYMQAEYFNDGLALVQDADGEFGYINEQGSYVISPRYVRGTSFSDGVAFVVTNGSHPICIDKTGEVKFTLEQANIVYAFREGLSRVIDAKGKYGFVGLDGSMVVNTQYDAAKDFSDGYAAVKQNGKWGFIDKKGTIKIKPQFNDVLSFHEGMAAFYDGTSWGYIDMDGKYAIAPQFSFARNFNDGLALVGMGNSLGYIDATGKIVINPQFTEAYDFNDGLAKIKQNRKYGYIDKDGKFIINPQFDNAYDFIGDVAIASNNNIYGLIDKAGKYLVNPKFAAVLDYNATKKYGIETDFFDISEVVNAICSRLLFRKAPTEFDGMYPQATLGDFIDWHGDNLTPVGNFGCYVSIVMNNYFSDEVTLCSVRAAIPEKFYRVEKKYVTDMWGFKKDAGTEVVYKRELPLKEITYEFKLTGKAVGKTAVVCEGLKKRIESDFYCTLGKKDSESDFYHGCSDYGFCFRLGYAKGDDNFSLSVYLNMSPEEKTKFMEQGY